MGTKTLSRHGTEPFLAHQDTKGRENKDAESSQTGSPRLCLWHVALRDFNWKAGAYWCTRSVLALTSEKQPHCVDLWS